MANKIVRFTVVGFIYKNLCFGEKGYRFFLPCRGDGDGSLGGAEPLSGLPTFPSFG